MDKVYYAKTTVSGRETVSKIIFVSDHQKYTVKISVAFIEFSHFPNEMDLSD